MSVTASQRLSFSRLLLSVFSRRRIARKARRSGTVASTSRSCDGWLQHGLCFVLLYSASRPARRRHRHQATPCTQPLRARCAVRMPHAQPELLLRSVGQACTERRGAGSGARVVLLRTNLRAAIRVEHCPGLTAGADIRSRPSAIRQLPAGGRTVTAPSSLADGARPVRCDPATRSTVASSGTKRAVAERAAAM